MSSWSKALVWSLIAAAFIGPGTVTTAARAGVEGGWHYAVYVALAAAAGFLLMEMAARLTVVSGQSFGALIGRRAGWLRYGCFGAVLLGCAAYQAGNLLGAIGGLKLLFPVPGGLVLGVAAVAFALLWFGSTQSVARVLAGLVALMGGLFCAAALYVVFSGADLAGDGRVATGTVVGIIGTTIVPYNFFLAAGLGAGRGLGDMRRGLAGSFLVGGVLTLSIVLVSSVAPAFTGFADLAAAISGAVAGAVGMEGAKGEVLLGVGLFAAGFSSAVTAPLAAALAGRELLGTGEARLPTTSPAYRSIWIGVLATGTLVALLDLDVVSIIVAAQVANGLLVPLIAILVLVLANDRSILGAEVNGWGRNVLAGGVILFLLYKSFGVLATIG